jgi:Zn-dependent M28 family amino/carboxypeptidase
LHSATDHLARRLEIVGYQVVRQGFPVGDEILQNLEVVLPGTQTGETLVIAARYDTAPESPGANASASGAAVLLALAKELFGQRLGRGVRLVWLSNESGTAGPPGSAVYTSRTRHDQLPVVATLTLGSLGYYSLRSGSQRYPAELLYGAENRSTFGDFVAVVSNAGSHALLERVRPVLAAASLPVEELILPDGAPLAAEGPQARFWQAGFSGLVLTDTAQFRSPHHDGPSDTLDKLDFDRLARVTRLLSTLVVTLAGPGGSLPLAPNTFESGPPPTIAPVPVPAAVPGLAPATPPG